MDVPWIGFPDTHYLDVSLSELGHNAIEMVMCNSGDSDPERFCSGCCHTNTNVQQKDLQDPFAYVCHNVCEYIPSS